MSTEWWSRIFLWSEDSKNFRHADSPRWMWRLSFTKHTSQETQLPVLLTASRFFSAEEEAVFTKNLANLEVSEGDTIKLVCEVSKPGAEVIWYKGDEEIIETGRFEILTDGRKRILIIQNAQLEDAGSYNCRLPSSRTDSKVKVHGMKSQWRAFSSFHPFLSY